MGKASSTSRRKRGGRKATPAADDTTPAADAAAADDPAEPIDTAEESVRRPRTVVAGAVLVYLGAVLVLLFGVFSVVGSTDASFLRSVESSAEVVDLPAAVFHQLVRDVGILAIACGAVGVAVAVLAQRGRRRARIVLTALAVVYALPLLLAAVDGSPPALLLALYVAVAAALFWVRGANRWYRAEQERRRST